MKKLLLILILFISVSFAQKADSLNLTSTDSVDLKALLNKQIEEAKKKRTELLSNVNTLNITNKEIKKIKINSTETNYSQLTFLSKLIEQVPLQYKIFLVISSLIIITLILRRSIVALKKKSLRKFKNRIALLREEKIGGSIINEKKRQVRIKLKDNPLILKQNENELTLNAKQLNISKGELLLAARLKLIELNKAQRSL